MKKVFLLLVTVLLFVSCNIEQKPKKSSSDAIQQRQTEQAAKQMNKEVGFPSIVNFTEKKQVKRIYELRDQENLIMHAYLVDELHGKIGQYLGKCIGYGTPYSTQFSNPEKVEVYNEWSNSTYGKGGVYGTLPQAEPNGLFTPVGLSATWLELIDPSTDEPHMAYFEPSIIVSPFKLH